MASAGARARRFAVDRYGTRMKSIEEGVEGLVPYRGSLRDIVKEFIGGVQASMNYIGASSIPEAREKGRLLMITGLGSSEVDPHDVVLSL
jgi:IMP dehydrogenase